MDYNILKAKGSNAIMGMLITFQLAMLMVIGVLLVQLLTSQPLPLTTIFSSVFLILICLPLSLFLYVSAPDDIQKKIFLSFVVSFSIIIASGILWNIVPIALPDISLVPLAKSLTVIAYVPFIIALVAVLRATPVNVSPQIQAFIAFSNVAAAVVILLLAAISTMNDKSNAFDVAIYTASTIVDIAIFSVCSVLALNFMQNRLRYVFMIMLIFFLLSLAGDSLCLLGALGWQGLDHIVHFLWDAMFILTAIALIFYALSRSLEVTTVEEVNRTLRDTKTLMGDLLMQSPAAIGIFDAGGDVVMANPSFREFVGASPEVAPDEMNLFRDGGRLFGAGTEIAGVMEGRTVKSEVARASDKHYHLKASPARDSGGRITGYIVILVDITDRKRYEEELVRAKNQAELYLDLMSHDISNMNQIGIGFLEMALQRIRLDNEGQMLLRKPLDAMLNSSHLIDNVKKIRRANTTSFSSEPIDLGRMLEDVIRDYRDVPGRDAVIEYVPVSENYVLANPLLRDVFSNLINNAFKHSTGPLKIWVKVSPVVDDRAKYYRVTIEDNGPGIPRDARRVLLEPAYSLRNRSSGGGLGLYLVKVLVDSFKGTITVEDRVPGDARPGARITVTLLAADDTAGGRATPQPATTKSSS